MFGLIHQTLRQSMRAQTKRIKGFGYLQGCVDYNDNPITPAQAEKIGEEIEALKKDLDNFQVGVIKIESAYHRLIHPKITQNNETSTNPAHAATNSTLHKGTDPE